jgi:hypothetical protein
MRLFRLHGWRWVLKNELYLGENDRHEFTDALYTEVLSV